MQWKQADVLHNKQAKTHVTNLTDAPFLVYVRTVAIDQWRWWPNNDANEMLITYDGSSATPPGVSRPFSDPPSEATPPGTRARGRISRAEHTRWHLKDTRWWMSSQRWWSLHSGSCNYCKCYTDGWIALSIMLVFVCVYVFLAGGASQVAPRVFVENPRASDSLFLTSTPVMMSAKQA